jgi:hypothetical protein
MLWFFFRKIFINNSIFIFISSLIRSSSIYFGTIVCNDIPPGNSNSSRAGGATNTNTGTQHDDAEILNKLYLAIGGPSWVESSNWLSTTTPVCAWYGIKSQLSGAVESIALKSNNLQGDLPSKIFLLRDLRSLLLDGNSINAKQEWHCHIPRPSVMLIRFVDDCSNARMHGLTADEQSFRL